jgi:hypothetical protein
MTDASLMKYFKFDEADLAANRSGVVSQKQIARLKGERSSFKTKARIVGGIIALGSMIILGGILWAGSLSGSGVLRVIIPLMFVFPFAVAGFLIFGKFADQNYAVKKVEGPIELGMTQTYNQDGTTNQHYRLRIGDQSFIAEAALSKIMTDGDAYRVYYADDWAEILSAEHL